MKRKSLFLMTFLILFATNISLSEELKDFISFNSHFDRSNKTTSFCINFDLPKYTLEEKHNWTEISSLPIKTSKLDKPDYPELPFFTFRISIPKDGKVQDIVFTSTKQVVGLNQKIKPVERPYLPLPGIKPEPLIANPMIYNSMLEYPHESVKYSIIKLGSSYILIINVFPFKHIGKENKLIVHKKMEITITLKCPSWHPDPKVRNAMDKMVKEMILNPEEAFFGAPLK